MTKEYSCNYDILCAACNKPRYFGYTDLPDSEMCCCHGQDKIPSYDRREELTEEALKYASEEDIAFFNKITEGLPTMAGKNGGGLDKFGVPIPHHSGPHILRHFRDAIEIVKPKSILEIGFNMGHSAAMWLNISNAKVISCDISSKDETVGGAKYLMENYKQRFEFYWRGAMEFVYSQPVLEGYFNLCFIDGAHDEENVSNDIMLCIDMKIPYLLFDDWYPRYGETQKAVALFRELELVKDMNNLRLYKVNYAR